MTTPSTTPPPVDRSWQRWAVWTLVLLGLALVPVVCLHFYGLSLEQRAQQLIDELDREEPGWRDLKSESGPVPPERDSSLVIDRICKGMPRKWVVADYPEDSVLDSNPPPCRLPKQDRDFVGAFVKECPASVAAARTLKDLPEGGLVLKLRPDGKDLDYLPVQQMRQVIGVLDWAILDALERDDVADAWELCKALGNLGKPLTFGNSWIGLSRMAPANTTLAFVERTLAHGQVPEPDLAAMQKALAAEAEVDFVFPYLPRDCEAWVRMHDDMMANRLGDDDNSDLFRKLAAESVKKQDIGWWDRLNERFPRFMLLQSKIESLRRIAATYRLRPLRGSARFDAFCRIEAEFGPRAGDGTQRYVWNNDIRFSCLRVELRIRARLGCGELALAAERFRLRFGRWPATVDELVDKGLIAKVPEDPFDGAPLRMRVTADGLVFFSISTPGRPYDGTWFDGLPRAVEQIPSNFIEFRLWNTDRRHQPPLPPVEKKKDD